MLLSDFQHVQSEYIVLSHLHEVMDFVSVIVEDATSHSREA